MAGANPHDWLCPNPGCINAVKGVFAKHQSCPKCGAPKGLAPGAGGMGGAKGGPKGGGGGGRPGDWLCPNPECINATKAVFGSKDNCPQCFAPREQGVPVAMAQRPSHGAGAGPQRQGDWMCPNPSCMNASKGVFGRHDSCPKCGASRHDGAPMGYADKGKGKGIGAPPAPSRQPQWNMPSAMPGPGGGQGEDWLCPNMTCVNSTKGVFGRHLACPKCGCCKPGDWRCPNGQCINHSKMVFEKNTLCPKCGTAKPGTPAAHEQQMQAERATMGMGNMGYGYAGPGPMSGPGPRPSARAGSGAPTDWRCPDPSCINHQRMVFGKHPNCPQCGAEKPAAQAKGGKGGKGMKPGDWACPNADCKNHTNGVFAKHDSCPACGSPKPDGLLEGGEDGLEGARDRSRSPRGGALF